MWRLTRKTVTVGMPDLAKFFTGDSKVLLRLGEKLLEAYIKGDKITEIYQVSFFVNMIFATFLTINLHVIAWRCV